MTNRRHPNVVNVSEVDAITGEKGTRFAFRDCRLAQAAGGRAIGCSWYEVPPGKTAFPHHYHTANEESLYVLEGSGTMRIGGEEVAVEPGDYIAFPVGPDHAHQLSNTGDAPLRYLCFSTMNPVEVVGYPDSDKLGVSAWSSDLFTRYLRTIIKRGGDVDYYDGEKVD